MAKSSDYQKAVHITALLNDIDKKKKDIDGSWKTCSSPALKQIGSKKIQGKATLVKKMKLMRNVINAIIKELEG